MVGGQSSADGLSGSSALATGPNAGAGSVEPSGIFDDILNAVRAVGAVAMPVGPVVGALGI
jgi:hypothetical protein